MRFVRGIVLALAFIVGASQPAAAQPDPWAKAPRKPGLVQAISPKLNEEAWFVPGGGDAVLKARVFRPSGSGPFKVAIVNHGSPPSGADRPKMSVPSFRSASEWLVERGYMVVLPLRRGYGEPENTPWPEKYGTCDNANYIAAGKAAADDIEAVARYARTMPMARKDRVVLIGQSAGGFGVAASAGRNIDGVVAVINFAGGRGGHQGPSGKENCAPDRLVTAMRTFGGGAKVPSLWLYAMNDTYFAPALSQRLADAFKAGGGNVDYRLLPAFRNEGHETFGSADGRPLWTPLVAEFLKRVE